MMFDRCVMGLRDRKLFLLFRHFFAALTFWLVTVQALVSNEVEPAKLTVVRRMDLISMIGPLLPQQELFPTR